MRAAAAMAALICFIATCGNHQIFGFTKGDICDVTKFQISLFTESVAISDNAININQRMAARDACGLFAEEPRRFFSSDRESLSRRKNAPNVLRAFFQFRDSSDTWLRNRFYVAPISHIVSGRLSAILNEKIHGDVVLADGNSTCSCSHRIALCCYRQIGTQLPFSGIFHRLNGAHSGARMPLSRTQRGKIQALGATYETSLVRSNADKENGEDRERSSEGSGRVCPEFLPPPFIVFGIAASMVALGFYIEAITRTVAGYVWGAVFVCIGVVGWLSLLFGDWWSPLICGAGRLLSVY